MMDQKVSMEGQRWVKVDDVRTQLDQIWKRAEQQYQFQGPFSDLIPSTGKNLSDFIQSHPPENGKYSLDDVDGMNKVLAQSFQVFDKVQSIREDKKLDREQKRTQVQNTLKDYVSTVISATGRDIPRDTTFPQLRRGDVSALKNIQPKDIDLAALNAFIGALPPLPQHDGGNGGLPFGPGGGNGATTNSDPSAHEDAANAALNAGDYPAALSEANQAVQAGGGVSALDLRADANYRLNNFTAANADAQAALKLNPQDQDANAILHFSADRVDGAASAAGVGPARGAGSRGAMNGSGAGSGGNAELAASAAAGAARVEAEEAAGKARAALGLGDGEAASAAIEKGLAADPGNSVLLGLRAQIEARKGEWAKSLADAEAALSHDPKNIALLRAKALAQLRTKDYAGAIATANEMLELDPNNADAFAIRGQAYGLSGRYDIMTADLQSAAALDPYYKDIAARAKAGTLVAPADSDVLFLLPGEGAAGAGSAAAPAGRARRFGGMLAAAAAGGLLMALGLLGTVLAPARRRAAEALARLTRTGPTLGELPPQPESVSAAAGEGLIRGQYELSREIGAGGMGRVYEGTDRSLGRRVAIKKMRDELRADPRERARFVAEAKTVAALHHPNIVDIYAIAEEGADVYLVFEYVDGKTVHELVYERGRLEPAAAASVTRACADALEFAHARGVIHRDMKPSNVMIDGAGQVKVMDFGIARAAKDALARGTMTNTVVGTPPYMAPEQEQGQVRRESDVYALAICAYEMLAGELPFSGVGMGMSLNKLNMAYEPVTKRVAGLPPTVDAAFARAFQPDPGKRWRSPAEFAAALESALAAPAAARA